MIKHNKETFILMSNVNNFHCNKNHNNNNNNNNTNCLYSRKEINTLIYVSGFSNWDDISSSKNKQKYILSMPC